MAIHDKFNIIRNDIGGHDEKKIKINIDNYLEKFFSSDIKLLNNDYFYQIIWFNKNILDNSIEYFYIKKFLIDNRNNIRKDIKRGEFSFDNLYTFIKNFITKVEYINNIISSPNNIIIKKSIEELVNIIISDSFIFMFIEEQLISFDNDIIPGLKKFVDIIKYLSEYDNSEITNEIIKIFTNIFIKQINEMKDYPLPLNINNIQKLKNAITYYNQIERYFDLINFKLNNEQFYMIIIQNLNNIIKNNSLDEIVYVFEKLAVNTYLSMIFANVNNSIIKNCFYKNIINLIDKTIKENNIEDIYKLINIYDFIYEENAYNINIKTNEYLTNKTIITQKISDVVCLEENINTVLIKIDKLIRNNDKYVINILKFAINFKDKDIFVQKYHKYLIQRLLEKISTDSQDIDHFEKKVIVYLKIKLGDKLVYKLNKVVFDTERTIADNINFNKIVFKKHNQHNYKMSVMITSYDNWGINQTDGKVNSKTIESIKHTKLGEYLYNYQEYYLLRYYNNRILNWFPHFGEINIEYLEKKIKMLPIQFMILELFNETDSVLISEIKSSNFLSTYSSTFINKIVHSFVVSKLFTIRNNYFDLTLVDDFDTNLIDVFFSISDFDYENVWEQKQKEDLCISRKEIVCANINKVIKLKPMTKTQLFDSLVKSITVFQLDKPIFENALEYMCEMDYINIKGEYYEKLFY